MATCHLLYFVGGKLFACTRCWLYVRQQHIDLHFDRNPEHHSGAAASLASLPPSIQAHMGSSGEWPTVPPSSRLGVTPMPYLTAYAIHGCLECGWCDPEEQKFHAHYAEQHPDSVDPLLSGSEVAVECCGQCFGVGEPWFRVTGQAIFRLVRIADEKVSSAFSLSSHRSCSHSTVTRAPSHPRHRGTSTSRYGGGIHTT